MKLAKQLAAVRRELIAHPKKAVALALLLAAAGWFWWPILAKRLGGSQNSPAATQPQGPVSQQVVTPAAATAAASRHASGKSQDFSWKQLAEAQLRDPLTRTAKFDPKWPQPFRVLATSSADVAGVPLVQLTPADAGLVLESIVYGKKTRAAMINGEIYTEGSQVPAAGAQGALATFLLVSIDAESVEMRRYDRTFRLSFPRPRLTRNGRLEAGRTSTSEPAQIP